MKAKISISVTTEQWEKALKMWDGKPSHLVDKLVCEYVEQAK